MKINTKILQGLKEAQEPKITLDQITELLSNLGFNIVKNETGVREPTASAYMEEKGVKKVCVSKTVSPEKQIESLENSIKSLSGRKLKLYADYKNKSA